MIQLKEKLEREGHVVGSLDVRKVNLNVQRTKYVRLSKFSEFGFLTFFTLIIKVN